MSIRRRIQVGDTVTPSSVTVRSYQHQTDFAPGMHGTVLNHRVPKVRIVEGPGRDRSPFFLLVGFIDQQGRKDRAALNRCNARLARRIPGLASWSMHAGGTGAAPGKHGFTYRASFGTYHISPCSTPYGRHAGYLLDFTNELGKVDQAGLWLRIGSFRSPQAAVKAAGEHAGGARIRHLEVHP
jgi:hypothetical protein